MKAVFEDETSSMELVWFKGVSWIKKSLKRNEQIVVFGKPTLYKGVFSISHPEIETIEAYKKELGNSYARCVPINRKAFK